MSQTYYNFQTCKLSATLQTDAFWDFVPCSSSSNRRFGELSSPTYGFLRVIGFHSCYRGSLLLSLSTEGYYVWSKNTVLWEALTAVSIKDALWYFVPCNSSSNRRFGGHVASVFSVPSDERIPQLHYRGKTLHRGKLFMVEELFCGTLSRQYQCMASGVTILVI
jgi:hypothetical protein